MTFNELEKLYINKEIEKAEYIEKAYQIFHHPLFELAERLSSTAISDIKINHEGVFMTFKDSGLSFLLRPGDKRLAPLDAINFKDYEKSEMDTQYSLIKPGQVVYDIGANFGWYSLHLSHHFKGNITIHAFEPVPSTGDLCEKNLMLNPGHQIQLHRHGFSDTSGPLDIFFSPSLSVNASLQPLSTEQDLQAVRCQFYTLNEYQSLGIPAPDFIKCDVEGAEWLVFKGGKELLLNVKPIIFSEMLRKWAAKFNYHPNDMIQWFADLGYSCKAVNSQGLRDVQMVDDQTPETNYVFLHSEKHQEFI